MKALTSDEMKNINGGWAIGVLFSGGILVYRGIVCMSQNMRKDGSFKKCDCGLHHIYVKKK